MGTAVALEPMSSLEVVAAGSAVAGVAVADASIFVGTSGLVVDRAPAGIGSAALLAGS